MSAQVFRLPDLGEGLTEAALIKWLVAVGDVVRVDQPIAEVETAKSVVEVPSPFAGTVAVLHGAEGETLVVGAPLVEVTAAAAGSVSTTPRRTPTAPRSAPARATCSSATARPSRRVRAAPAGRAARPTVRALRRRRTGVATGPLAVRSPIVRRLAQERGVDLHAVTPTGPEGIITRDDVLGAAPVARPPPAAPGARRWSRAPSR